ncbi:MAG TPA: DUF481 domain-containing protein [Longimicrobiales bacterium]|nr:DUF481 domain-containing protein [Longimicrobiales bacterium]
MRERTSAYISVRAVLRAAGDSIMHELSFLGMAILAGRADTLQLVVSRSQPADAVQEQLTRVLHLGLVRYAAAAALDRNLQIAFVPAAAAAASDNSAVGAAAPPVPPAPRPSTAPAETAARRTSSPPADEPTRPKRWAFAVDLGFTGSSGNSELVALTTGVRVKHLQTRLFRLDWSASFRYGESAGEVAARYLQSKLEFDMGPSARIAPFISATGERDPFRRLDLKSKSGTGVRYSFYKTDRGEASLRASALYSYERFTPDAERATRRDGAWSMKLNGNRRVGESIRIENATSFDPVMGDFRDYNLEITSKLSTRITRSLALTFSHSYSYDSTPARNVERVDQRLQTGLTMEF